MVVIPTSDSRRYAAKTGPIGVASVLGAVHSAFGRERTKIREVVPELVPKEEWPAIEQDWQATPDPVETAEAQSAPFSPGSDGEVVGEFSDVAETDVEVALPPPIPLHETSAPAPPAEDEPGAICHIALWRGYRHTRFYAAMSSDGEVVVVAESPSFRMRSGGIPERTGEALAAYRRFSDELIRAGWRRVGEGDVWWADVFQLVLPAVEEEPGQTPP
jgi:hypothetical protein